MALLQVIALLHTKPNFHPVGEKAKSCERRDSQHLQRFEIASLWN
jgi:hypothetical protein